MEAVKLLTKYTQYFLAIFLAGAVARLIYLGFQKTVAVDEGSISDIDKKIGITLKATVITASIEGFIAFVKIYYQ